MPIGVSRAVIEVLLDRIQQGAATLSPEVRIAYVNQRFASLLGQSRAQLVGRPFAELVSQTDRESLASALATGRDGTSQCRLSMPRGNGGGELQALVTFAPLGHGQTSCLLTDLAQGNHVIALAHEIRSMLGAIRNSVELLKRSPLDADCQRAIAAMERHSAQMLQLLNSKEQGPSS
jgi:PAS domain S-box-containing protein